MRSLAPLTLGFVFLFACGASGSKAEAPAPTASAAPTVTATTAAPPPPQSECAKDADCAKGFHCACPAAGQPDFNGHAVCGGPSKCYPVGADPIAMP